MVDNFDDIFAALDQLPVETVIPTVPPPPTSEYTDTDYYSAFIAELNQIRPVEAQPVAVPAPTVALPTGRLPRDKVLALAQEIYGEDRVDLQLVNANSYNLFIYFPQFTITDGKFHHIIRGLYTKFVVSEATNSDRVLSQCLLYGIRAILTPEEAAHSYGHSHLDSCAAKGEWAEFCQGASQFKVLFVNLIVNPTEDAWRMVLLSLPRYVEWESREGGPYKHIANISSSAQQGSPFDFQGEIRQIAHNIPADVFEFTKGLEITFQSPKMDLFYQQYSPVKTLRNVGQNVSQVEREWRHRNRMSTFRFKGEMVNMTIVSSDDTVDSTLVERDVITGFNAILTTFLRNFNNKLDHEYARYNNNARLGEIPAFQQADINHYKKVARNRRALSRARRKQGVVGGVNYIRKREDNRFGQLGDNSGGHVPG